MTPLVEDADRLARARAYLEQSPYADRIDLLLPMSGDASDRRYFRVRLADGESIVLAVHAGSIDAAASPFVKVAELLRGFPVPVPAILGHSDRNGVIALEDLGDVTLQTHLERAGPEELLRRYREAASMIRVMQQRGEEFEGSDCPPYQLAFDVEKLTAELDFFVLHFLEAHRRASPSAAERAVLAEEWQIIAGELSAERRVFCHRDFHSRNLMVHRGRLYAIDFQDARLGPDTYDLASLLRDSYLDVGDQMRDDVLDYFLRVKQEPDADEFRRRFDLMSVQRNLKALGTFGYQATSRGKTGYLADVPRTLGYLRGNLSRYSRFSRLRELLATYLEELR